MSIQDPISDLLTRIRNGQQAKHENVIIPASKVKRAILDVLVREGFLANYVEEEVGNHPYFRAYLKYHHGKGVIELLQRVSRPGLRQYKSKAQLPKIRSGLGCAIVSTSKGVMTDDEARRLGEGGEILCVVA